MNGKRQRRTVIKSGSMVADFIRDISQPPLPADFAPQICCRCGQPFKKSRYHVFWDGDTPCAECWPCYEAFAI